MISKETRIFIKDILTNDNDFYNIDDILAEGEDQLSKYNIPISFDAEWFNLNTDLLLEDIRNNTVKSRQIISMQLGSANKDIPTGFYINKDFYNSEYVSDKTRQKISENPDKYRINTFDSCLVQYLNEIGLNCEFIRNIDDDMLFIDKFKATQGDKERVTLHIDLYNHLAIVDLDCVFTSDTLNNDLKDLVYNRNIEHTKRAKVFKNDRVSYSKEIVLPYILKLIDYDLDVNLSINIIDFTAVMGMASLDDICKICDIELPYKDLFTSKEKAEMHIQFDNDIERFYNYSMGDLVGTDIFIRINEDKKKLCELLGIKDYLVTSRKLTLGSENTDLQQQFIASKYCKALPDNCENTTQARKDRDDFLDNFSKNCSSLYTNLHTYGSTTAKYISCVAGGRINKTFPEITHFLQSPKCDYHIVDIDISGAYQNAMTWLHYVKGNSILLGLELNGHELNNEYPIPDNALSLKKVLEKLEKELADDCWLMVVEARNLTYAQDLIVSNNKSVSITDKKVIKDRLKLSEQDRYDNKKSNTGIYTRDIYRGIITSDILDTLKVAYGDKKYKKYLTEIKVIAIQYLPKSNIIYTENDIDKDTVEYQVMKHFGVNSDYYQAILDYKFDRINSFEFDKLITNNTDFQEWLSKAKKDNPKLRLNSIEMFKTKLELDTFENENKFKSKKIGNYVAYKIKTYDLKEKKVDGELEYEKITTYKYYDDLSQNEKNIELYSFDNFVKPLADARAEEKKKRIYKDGKEIRTPKENLLKLYINTTYGTSISPVFNFSNLFIGQMITAKVRSLMFLLEKALLFKGSITDGHFFHTKQVLYRDNNNYLNLNYLVENEFNPRAILQFKAGHVKPLEYDNQIAIKTYQKLIKVFEEHVRNNNLTEKEYNDEYNKLIEKCVNTLSKEISEKAIQHTINLFPTSKVLKQGFSLEIKSYLSEYVLHGIANYEGFTIDNRLLLGIQVDNPKVETISFVKDEDDNDIEDDDLSNTNVINPDKDKKRDIKHRGFSAKKKYFEAEIDFNNDEIKMFDNGYNPIIFKHDQLRFNTNCCKLIPLCVVEEGFKKTKPFQDLSRVGTKNRISGLFLGDSSFTVKTTNYISLSEFKYPNFKLKQEVLNFNQNLKNKYGIGIELFYFKSVYDDDGIYIDFGLDYEEAKKDIQKLIYNDFENKDKNTNKKLKRPKSRVQCYYDDKYNVKRIIASKSELLNFVNKRAYLKAVVECFNGYEEDFSISYDKGILKINYLKNKKVELATELDKATEQKRAFNYASETVGSIIQKLFNSKGYIDYMPNINTLNLANIPLDKLSDIEQLMYSETKICLENQLTSKLEMIYKIEAEGKSKEDSNALMGIMPSKIENIIENLDFNYVYNENNIHELLDIIEIDKDNKKMYNTALSFKDDLNKKYIADFYISLMLLRIYDSKEWVNYANVKEVDMKKLFDKISDNLCDSVNKLSETNGVKHKPINIMLDLLKMDLANGNNIDNFMTCIYMMMHSINFRYENDVKRFKVNSNHKMFKEKLNFVERIGKILISE